MSEAQWFSSFCSELRIGQQLRDSIAYRAGRMTRQLNEDFRATSSETANRFYAGSYGRETAIKGVSDIDVVFVLPYSVYAQYNAYSGNKQSSLLQAVRSSLQKTYPSSQVAGDGQVVAIEFTDNITFEILPAFINDDESYTFADANNGGSWRTCKPKHEIDAFAVRDGACNGNLRELGRMVRAWRDYNSVPMSGMLIDALAYQFIETWPQRDKSYAYYDWLTRDFFGFLAQQSPSQTYWYAPGSGSYVRRTGSFEYKARQAELRAQEAIAHLQRQEHWAAKQKFRVIYGTDFPG